MAINLSDDELRRQLEQAKRYEMVADELMPYLIHQESRGRPGVEGPQTKYGRAYGLTQLLPGTARQMAARAGLEWRPELLRGKTQEAADYQHRLGREYLIEGLQQTGGDVQQSLMYYHGGPDRKIWGPKTRAYAAEIMTNARRNPSLQLADVLAGNGKASQEETADLTGMSDAELREQLRVAREENPENFKYVPKSDSPFMNSKTGARLNEAQSATYARLAKDGDFDPAADPGSIRLPLAQMSPDEFPEEGKWFVDVNGKVRQMGATKPHGDFMEGVIDSAFTVANNIGRVTRFPGAEEARKEHDDYLARRAEDGVVPSTAGKIAGGVIFTSPVALIPGLGQGYVGAAVTGAGSSALLTKEDDLGGVAKDATIGALGGVAANKMVGGVARGFNPAFKNADGKLLADAGVKVTPGQAIGPRAAAVEDRFIKGVVPFVGGAQRRSADSFSTGAINTVLKDTGIKVPGKLKGEQALKYAQDSVAAKLATVTDPAELQALTTAAKNLGVVQEATQAAWNAAGKFTPAQLAAANKAAAAPVSDLDQFATAGRNILGADRPAAGPKLPLGVKLPGGAAIAAQIPLLAELPLVGKAAAAAPGVGIGVGTAASAYTSPGAAAIRGAILADRPAWAQQAGQTVDKVNKLVRGLPGGSAAASFGEGPARPTVEGDYVMRDKPIDQVQTGLPEPKPVVQPTKAPAPVSSGVESLSDEELLRQLEAAKAGGF